MRGATADPGIAKEPKGSAWHPCPGHRYRRHLSRRCERVFRDVRDPAKAVVIQLADERYARLVIQVLDARAAVALVENALPN